MEWGTFSSMTSMYLTFISFKYSELVVFLLLLPLLFALCATLLISGDYIVLISVHMSHRLAIDSLSV